MLYAITCGPKVNLLERINWLRGRVAEGVSPRFRWERDVAQRIKNKCHESRVKFVYFKDKSGMLQNVSLVEREC